MLYVACEKEGKYLGDGGMWWRVKFGVLKLANVKNACLEYILVCNVPVFDNMHKNGVKVFIIN